MRIDFINLKTRLKILLPLCTQMIALMLLPGINAKKEGRGYLMSLLKDLDFSHLFTKQNLRSCYSINLSSGKQLKANLSHCDLSRSFSSSREVFLKMHLF